MTVQPKAKGVDHTGLAGEDRYHKIFHSTSVAMTISEIDSGLVFDANERFLKLVGRPREQVIGRTTAELGLWVDLAQRKKLVEQLKTEGFMREFEILVRDRAGNTLPHLCSADLMQIDGRALLLVSAVDISARKRAEEQLRASEERYRQLFELESDAIFLVDRDTRAIVDANASATRLYGYTRDELLRMENTDLSAEPNQTREALSTKLSHESVRWHRKNNGTIFPVEITASYVSREGRTYQIAAIRDITERIEADRALRESESRFGAFMENVPSMVLIKNQELRPVYANRQYRQAFPVDQWMGKRPAECFPEDVAEAVEARDREAFANGYAEFEETWSPNSGGTRHLRTQKFRIASPSTPDLLGTIITDVTSQRQAEEALRNAQRLEALGNLAGGIAHDFNNLLGGLFGYLSLARDVAQHDSEVAGYLDEALAAFNRARSLTQQLLTFSKGGEPVKQAVDVKRLLHEVVRFALSGSNAMPVFHLADDLCGVEGDAGQLGQVVDNITINARQAMPTGGTLVVRAVNVPPDERLPAELKPGRYVRIDFSDRGVGIPNAQLPRVFDPFFTTKQQGSGLGLATSYSIVKRHGGSIVVESAPGDGSTFRVYLPMAACTSGGASAASTQRSATRPKASPNARVLVMDDEKLVRDVVGATLRRLGYEVTCVDSGERAVQAFETALANDARYHVAILDLTVPGAMGGVEAATLMANVLPGFPMIVASGYSEDPVMADPRAYGFAGRLPKPFKVEDVRKEVENVLGHGRGDDS